jgi:hypothetical protein
MIAAVVMAAAMFPAQADDPHALEMAGVEFADAAAGVRHSSARSSFFGEPGFDQRLIGNIPLISRNFNALKKFYCRRNDIAVVDGLRFGKRTRCAFVQSI